jgi:hypothetical protein
MCNAVVHEKSGGMSLVVTAGIGKSLEEDCMA